MRGQSTHVTSEGELEDAPPLDLEAGGDAPCTVLGQSTSGGIMGDRFYSCRPLRANWTSQSGGSGDAGERNGKGLSVAGVTSQSRLGQATPTYPSGVPD
jgi:hypothetical protein